MARIEIPSENRSWRPGMFITASLKIDSRKSVPVVQKNAVQVLHEKNVIFIPEENNTFEPIEVVLGKSDDKYVEVLKGIHSGEQYVSDGAFEIKAKIVTSALGDHAGHGH
jgi:cobalt-zinc-cadmium efflux system membrane fusion protein